MARIVDTYIGIRLSQALNARLAALAERESNAVSSVVRRLLVSALDCEDEARKPRRRSPLGKRDR
jgi:predicted DNA-binding protein